MKSNSCKICVPFIRQIPTSPLELRQKCRHAVAIEVAGFCDRPARGNIAHQGFPDLCAVHQPDPDIAVGIAPENVGLTVAIEIAGADDRPAGVDINQNGSCKIRVPFINQMPTSPLELRCRMSL